MHHTLLQRMNVLHMLGIPANKYVGDTQMQTLKQGNVNQLLHVSNRPKKLSTLLRVSCYEQAVNEHDKCIVESPTQFVPIIPIEADHANRKYIDIGLSEACQYVADLDSIPYSEMEFADKNQVKSCQSLEGRVKEAVNLPDDLEFCTCDVSSYDTLVQIHHLLTVNYVEDYDSLFRMNYSKEFLQWALQPPGYFKNWHIGIRNQTSNKLVAFVSAVPAHVKVDNRVNAVAEVNFLCVDKQLRSKRLAPLLIKEITRRVNMKNIWQGVFTSDLPFHKPTVTCQYWHCPINPVKLVDEGLFRIGTRMTIDRMVKLYNLPESTSTSGFRRMETHDVADVQHMLQQYLSQFIVCPAFDEQDVAHWFLPVDNVISSFVVQDPVSNEITDFCSFYIVPFKVLNKDNTYVYVAYSYYNVSTRTPTPQLMKDAIIMAQRQNCDVFNALDIMHNHTFLKKLKFSPGDGHLHYHLYNCKLNRILPSNLGLVLL